MQPKPPAVASETGCGAQWQTVLACDVSNNVHRCTIHTKQDAHVCDCGEYFKPKTITVKSPLL